MSDQLAGAVIDVPTEPITFDVPLPSMGQQAVESPKAFDGGPRSYKNIEMEQMIAALEKYLERTDKIGYAAARNTRILRAETQEYFNRRQALIEKYGKPQIGEDGQPTNLTELRFDSPEFVQYATEIEEWAFIEHSPDLYLLPSEEGLGKLSGSEMLEIDWMFVW